MNEEEIIKYVEEEIKSNINIIGTYENENNPLRQRVVEHVKAYKGLLDLYKKEKEENKLMKSEFERLEDLEDETDELKLLLKEEKEKNKELEKCIEAEESYSKGLNEDIKSLLKIEPNTNFIYKEKIKEKTKEYKNMIEKLNKKSDIDRIKAINERIIAFQELLLEE